ncbi:hypothetical protein [Streptomyces sp. NPDC020983]|uniref:hypothetical protein n=1 Tax=Streptomyces sp. NPDC020983 TaxID=3365106 RepID=UPI00378D0BEF
MPDYRYTGDDARYYPSLGLSAVPDGAEGGPTVATFDERPAAADGIAPAPVADGARYAPDDGRWEPVPAAKKKTTAPAPSPAPAPADSGQKEG